MRGLFIKDLALLKMQKWFWFFMVFITVLIGKENPFAGVSYLTFMSAMILTNTIYSDEYANGHAFLFTLPFTRQIYVRSKYLLSILGAGIAWTVSMIVAVVVQIQITPNENSITILQIGSFILMVVFTFISIIIPIQLKYEQNKVFVILTCISGLAAVIGFAIFKWIEIFGIDVTPLLQLLNSMDLSTMILVVFMIVCVMMRISYVISCHVMKRKEF